MSGIFISYYSSSHNGDQEVIGGTTDGLGILDSPNAITGAYWNFGANFTPSAVPTCGTASDKNVVMVYPVSEELFSCFPTTGPAPAADSSCGRRTTTVYSGRGADIVMQSLRIRPVSAGIPSARTITDSRSPTRSVAEARSSPRTSTRKTQPLLFCEAPSRYLPAPQSAIAVRLPR